MTEVVDVVSNIRVVKVGYAARIGGSGRRGRCERRHGAGHLEGDDARMTVV